jgi:hypothetical protein
MGPDADSIFHALLDVLEEADYLQRCTGGNHLSVLLYHLENFGDFIRHRFYVVPPTLKGIEEQQGNVLQALSDKIRFLLFQFLDAGKTVVNRGNRGTEDAELLDDFIASSKRLANSKNQGEDYGDAQQGDVEIEAEIKFDAVIGGQDTEKGYIGRFSVYYGEVFLHGFLVSYPCIG